MKYKCSGFTLVEMMVVIAVIGILSGIAYPAYLEQVRKSTRADAKLLLNDVAQRMQRCFTANSTYKPAAAGTCDVVDKVTSSNGITSSQGFYTVKLADADHTASKYVLKITPITGKRQALDTKCSSFTLDQAGVKKAYNSSDADYTTECW